MGEKENAGSRVTMIHASVSRRCIKAQVKKGSSEKRYLYTLEKPTTQFFNSDPAFADILQSKCKKCAYCYPFYLCLSNHFHQGELIVAATLIV